MTADEAQGARERRGTALSAVGLALLIAGVVTSWLASKRQGHDYACVYLTGSGILSGSPIYERTWQSRAFPSYCGIAPPQGMFYPPSTGFATLPLALFAYPVAHALWFAIMIGVVIIGIRSIVRFVRPAGAAHEWLIAAALVLLSSCVRWGMTAQQGAPVILGLACLFVVALHKDRAVTVLAIAAFATAFKTTLALPFLGLLFVHRRYAAVAASLAIWVALNAAGFARVGGFGALAAYQENVRGLEALGDINTPDPWSLTSVPRLDWIYLFDGLIRSVSAARIAALALAAATGLWLLVEARRVRPPIDLWTTAAFLAPFVYLADASVYHHHYDISLIVPALLIAWLGSKRLREPAWATWLSFPLVAMIGFLPVATLKASLVNHFGFVGGGLMNLVFPIALTLAMAGSLVILRELVARPA